MDDQKQDDVFFIDLGALEGGKLAKAEQEFFSEIDDEDRRKQKIINDGMEQDNGLRFDYAEKAYGLVRVWVAFTIVLIVAQFLKPWGFYLAKEEFIAVILSLTGTMFGFWMLVGRYLFPNGGSRAALPGKNPATKNKKKKN